VNSFKADDEKRVEVSGAVYRYSAKWTKSLESSGRWAEYWQQQQLMARVIGKGDRVLEIGVGSGFTSHYLRSKGVDVVTLDIDEEKCPDIVANMVSFDWSKLSVDYILAFEVFEHIPFSEFASVLPQLGAACRKGLFASIPKCQKLLFHCDCILPVVGPFSFRLAVPRRKVAGANYHFWEVGARGTRWQDVERVIADAGMTVTSLSPARGKLFMRLEDLSTMQRSES
jgi:hypothetical protein